MIAHWQDNSNFRGILDRLLAVLENTDAADISVPLTTQPATPIPPLLSSRLAVTGTLAAGTLALVWSGKRTVTAPELTALQLLQADADLGAAARTIAGQLIGTSSEVSTVTIAPRDDWQPRPDLATMPPALAAKLLLGRARLSFPGPLPRAAALALRSAAPSPADRQVIERLFKESLSAGLGGTLKIRARRSSAPASLPVEVEVSL